MLALYCKPEVAVKLTHIAEGIGRAISTLLDAWDKSYDIQSRKKTNYVTFENFTRLEALKNYVIDLVTGSVVNDILENNYTMYNFVELGSSFPALQEGVPADVVENFWNDLRGQLNHLQTNNNKYLYQL